MKFGRVKSLCWLLSTVVGILQGILISKPFKIITSSAVLAKLQDRKQKVRRCVRFKSTDILLEHYSVWFFFHVILFIYLFFSEPKYKSQIQVNDAPISNENSIVVTKRRVHKSDKKKSQ